MCVRMKQASGELAHQVELWTQQTLSFGRFLVRLYRCLRDDKQAAAALEVMAPSEERAARLGLIKPRPFYPPNLHDETEAEAQAWETLLEAQMGFCSFHAMVDGPSGAKRTAERAYFRAVRGFETAFPVEWVTIRRKAILHKVSAVCADLFIQDLGTEGSPEKRAELHEMIESGIRQGFSQAESKTNGLFTYGDSDPDSAFELQWQKTGTDGLAASGTTQMERLP